MILERLLRTRRNKWKIVTRVGLDHEYHISYGDDMPDEVGGTGCSIFATKENEVTATAKWDEWVVECYPEWHHAAIQCVEETEPAALHRLVEFVVIHENAIRDECIEV